MSNWSDPSWKMRVGINHVPAFQTSGRPFASGGIDANADQQVVNFPYVTRWIQVVNDGSGSVKVGFGPNAFIDDNKNYFMDEEGMTMSDLVTGIKSSAEEAESEGGYVKYGESVEPKNKPFLKEQLERFGGGHK